MADDIEDSLYRFQNILSDVEERVEKLREQAHQLSSERENLLQVLQDVQDNANHDKLTEADRDELNFDTDRLIFRCLTVDVLVSTPRDESQEEAFTTVAQLIDNLAHMCTQDPEKNFNKLESYLNASLAEPISANVDSRFQSKLLGCTVDDQKQFKKTLLSVHKRVKSKLNKEKEKNGKVEGRSETNGTHGNEQENGRTNGNGGANENGNGGANENKHGNGGANEKEQDK